MESLRRDEGQRWLFVAGVSLPEARWASPASGAGGHSSRVPQLGRNPHALPLRKALPDRALDALSIQTT
jgi:hypothetical protein